MPPSVRLENLIAAKTAPEPLLLKTIRNTRELVLKQGDQHLFEVEFWIDDTDGYLIVRKNYQIVGGVFGGFGYGPADEYCLHWGIYRNSRMTRTVARMALEGWDIL